MPQARYRLALAVTASEMPDVAHELSQRFPALAKAIESQWLELTNSGVNVFSSFEHDSSEPDAGLSRSPIVLMTGIAD